MLVIAASNDPSVKRFGGVVFFVSIIYIGIGIISPVVNVGTSFTSSSLSSDFEMLRHPGETIVFPLPAKT